MCDGKDILAYISFTLKPESENGRGSRDFQRDWAGVPMGTRHVLPTVQPELKVEVCERSFALTDRSAIRAELLPAICIGTPEANLYAKSKSYSQIA